MICSQHEVLFGIDPRWQIRTQYDISIRSFFLEDIRIIEPAEHNANVWIGLLDNVCFVLRADESRILVVWVLLVQGVESIAGYVAGHTGAVVNLSLASVVRKPWLW